MARSVNIDSSNIRDLAVDFGRVPNRATKGVARAVESVAKHGNDVAAAFAKESAGDHGKWYHRAFEAEKAHPLGLTWVYGPNANKRQGGMSFEGGSRNQPPHLDLARSADLIGPELARKVGNAIEDAVDEH